MVQNSPGLLQTCAQPPGGRNQRASERASTSTSAGQQALVGRGAGEGLSGAGGGDDSPRLESARVALAGRAGGGGGGWGRAWRMAAGGLALPGLSLSLRGCGGGGGSLPAFGACARRHPGQGREGRARGVGAPPPEHVVRQGPGGGEYMSLYWWQLLLQSHPDWPGARPACPAALLAMQTLEGAAAAAEAEPKRKPGLAVVSWYLRCLRNPILSIHPKRVQARPVALTGAVAKSAAFIVQDVNPIGLDDGAQSQVSAPARMARWSFSPPAFQFSVSLTPESIAWEIHLLAQGPRLNIIIVLKIYIEGGENLQLNNNHKNNNINNNLLLIVGKSQLSY